MAVAAKVETMKSKNKLWFHIIMMFLLIGGFSVMPPIGSITPIGMKLVGIFLAMRSGAGQLVDCFGPVF